VADDPADASIGSPPPQPGAGAPTSLVVRDVHVEYRIYEDSNTNTLRRLFSNRMKPRVARRVHAVRGVTFDVHEGESVALIGRNGSGKSTLLGAIGGLLPTAAGAIYARSTPVVLGVQGALHRELSGRRNVFLGGTALGIPRAVLEERFDDIVAFAGLEEFIDLPLRAYSSGMAARLQFSVASSVAPDILCIDEALAVGDQEFRDRSRDRILELTANAGAVFLVTHNMMAVRELCTRGIWMEAGEMVLDGDIDVVADAYLEHVAERQLAQKSAGLARAVTLAPTRDKAQKAADEVAAAAALLAGGEVRVTVPPQHENHFFKPIEGRDPVFVVGLGRSGTTMLRLMLQRNPELSMLSETWFVNRVWARRWAYPTYDPPEPFRTRLLDRYITMLGRHADFPIDLKAYRGQVLKGDASLARFLDELGLMLAEQEGSARWGEKTPVHVHSMDLLARMFPGATFVHTVRDPRDAAASLVAAPFTKLDDPVAFTLQWVRTLADAQRQERDQPELAGRVVTLRYESVVADPATALREVCDRAALPWSDDMLHFEEAASEHAPDQPWMAGVHQPINTSSIGRFRTDIAPDDLEVMEALALPQMQQWGYEPVTSAARLEQIGPAVRRAHAAQLAFDDDAAGVTADHISMHRGEYRDLVRGVSRQTLGGA